MRTRNKAVAVKTSLVKKNYVETSMQGRGCKRLKMQVDDNVNSPDLSASSTSGISYQGKGTPLVLNGFKDLSPDSNMLRHSYFRMKGLSPSHYIELARREFQNMKRSPGQMSPTFVTIKENDRKNKILQPAPLQSPMMGEINGVTSPILDWIGQPTNQRITTSPSTTSDPAKSAFHPQENIKEPIHPTTDCGTLEEVNCLKSPAGAALNDWVDSMEVGPNIGVTGGKNHCLEVISPAPVGFLINTKATSFAYV